MGIADKILPHYTYDDWVHWEGKWELIEGFPVARSPSPCPLHQRVSASLSSELLLALRKLTDKSCKVYGTIAYKIGDDIILVPDILIICGEIKKKYLDFPPSLVVEILSPSTALRDRHTKFEIYRQQGVKYYLIVDTDKKSIEIYMLKNEAFALQKFNKSYTFYLENNFSITPHLSNIFE